MYKVIRTPLLLLLCTLGACTTSHIDQIRQGATSIKTGESIVILGRRQNNKYETDSKFVGCVAATVANGLGSIKVVPEKEFLDSMFPYFEPRTAPMRTTHLKQLMDISEARKRIKEFGIEYIVWVDGTTLRSDNSLNMSCGVAPGMGACFGFGTWKDDSKFEAEVWDIKTLESVGSISADANGQSYMPALVVPIPLIAQVEAAACSGLGNQLKQFIGGKGS